MYYGYTATASTIPWWLVLFVEKPDYPGKTTTIFAVQGLSSVSSHPSSPFAVLVLIS